MTRDDLRGIIEGITDEQLKKILDIHSSDIGRAKSGAEELRTQLETANSRITELETSLGDAEEMRIRIKELQKSIDDRIAEDAEKEKREGIEKRFDGAVGDRVFINDLTRKGLVSEFAAALERSENSALTDAEIFTRITEGQDNLFVPEGGIPSVVASTTFGGGAFTDNDIREIMGLPAE